MSTATEETFEFQAEVGRVMDIIINSLYSDRDVFLRELVSNAADACDKRRFLGLTTDDSTTEAPSIKIFPDPINNTLTIEDTGVGLTKEEMMNNLGRIAQSGTKAFMEAMESKDLNLIGQFGVGFYSGFLVADKMEVISRSMNAKSKSEVFKWTSEAQKGSYSIDQLPESEIEHVGTKIVLHLRDDASDYLEASKIESLLTKYSEFIEFPISVYKEKTEYKQVPDDEANEKLEEGEEPKMKTVPIKSKGYEQLNNQKPIWLRSPSEVTEEEYSEFYKAAFKSAYDDPMTKTHFVLEGQIEARAILYIPGMLPYELSKDMFADDSRNIRLYVRRVFINDKFEELMPRWLKFVRGVVDSNDLPLNVGREILQQSKALKIINKRLVRKSLDMIREIESADDEGASYVQFWNNFGKYLKVGIVEDGDDYKKDLAPLLRFFSSKSGEEHTSLDKYVEGMPEDQKEANKIYYVTGEGLDKAKMSPSIEKLSKKGYEVLFMTEPLDEIMIETLNKFKEYKLVDASKDGAFDDDKDEVSKKENEEATEALSDLIDYLEMELSDKVKGVKISNLLSESPAALVQGAYGMSPTMQRYMQMQSVSMGEGSLPGMGSMNQAVLEINPSHPVVKELNTIVKANGTSGPIEDPIFKNKVTLLYDVAAMTSGYEVSDPAEFAKRVISLMSSDVSVPDAVVEEESDEGDEAEAVTAEVM